MQRGDAWGQVAGRVARRRRARLVDFVTPALDACTDAIADAAAGGAAVAYSMGGRLTLHAAVDRPSAFRAMVLVGATPGIEDDAVRRSRRAADESLAAWIDRAPIHEVVAFWESQPVFESQSPSLVAAQRRGRLSFDPRHLAALLRVAGQGSLEPLWDRLGDLTLPVLLVAGGLDDKYAEIAREMAAVLPFASTAIVPGAGHAPQLERPAEFSELVLPFLDQHLR